jgi:predicted porin
MGRFLAPYDDIHGIFGNDNTASTSILSTAAVWAQGFAGQPNAGGFDDRLQQSIRYDSPRMAGFQFQGQFFTNGGGTLGAGPCTSITNTPNACNAPASNANGYSLSGGYNNGPFQGLVAYESHHNTRIGGAGATGTLRPLSDQAFSVAAKWQFTGWNIAAVYEKMEYEVQNGPVVNKLKRDWFWAVDTTINVGANGQIFLFWGKAADGSGSAVITPAPVVTPNNVATSNISRVAGLAMGPDTGATQWEASYSYDLSKRTRLYTGYVKINNDNNATYTFNINSYNVSAGGKPGGFVMGMIHSF